MSLLIGIHIKEMLLKDEGISEKVGNRVYPLVIPVGAPKYPFIVFRNDGTVPDYTKDGNNEDSVGVSVEVVAKEYGEAVEIGNSIRYALEEKRRRYEQFEVRDCALTGTAEEWLDDIDAYGIILNFEMKTVDF
jgi:hypothetical protein